MDSNQVVEKEEDNPPVPGAESEKVQESPKTPGNDMNAEELTGDDPFDAEVADVTLQASQSSSPCKNVNNTSSSGCEYLSEKVRGDGTLSSSQVSDEIARSSSVCSSMEDFAERPSSSIATQEDAHGSAPEEDLDMDMVDSAEDTPTAANSSGEIVNTKGEHEVTGASNDATNNKCSNNRSNTSSKLTSCEEKNAVTISVATGDDEDDNNGKVECVTNRAKNGTSNTYTGTGSTVSSRQSSANNSSSYKRKKHSWRRGKYTRSAGHSKGKGRRIIFKKTVYKSPASFASPIALDSVTYGRILYRKGDIVCLQNEDTSDTMLYFAQIRGFLIDQYAQKSASVTWLIPTSDATDDGTFDPACYILGPEEDTPRSLDTLEFVCHAPSDYYRHKSPYPLQPEPLASANLGYTWTRLGIVHLARKGETIHQIDLQPSQASSED